jgi:hypothetical protein
VIHATLATSAARYHANLTGRELAAAKSFKVSSMVYGSNLASANGTNNLISGT